MTASKLSKYCSAGVSKGRRCDSSCAMTEHLATIQVRKRVREKSIGQECFQKSHNVFGSFCKIGGIFVSHITVC